jgi:phosphatidylglycerophosphatase A
MGNIVFTKDDITNIMGNPLLSIRSKYRIDLIDEINKFEQMVDKLRSDKHYSQYRILYEMINFAKYYELFRPNKITKNDFYFGTVKIMDTIYFTLFKYIESELLFSFTHSVADMKSEYSSFKKQKHEDIYWDEMIDDIRSVSNAIMASAEEKAIELYSFLGIEIKYFVIQLIERYILRINKNISKNDIKSDRELLIVCGKKIERKNFFQQIYNISK